MLAKQIILVILNQTCQMGTYVTMVISEVAQGRKINTGLKKKNNKIDSRACFVLKTLEKSDVSFPFTVAALTLNL